MNFKQYTKTTITEMRPYIPGEDLSNVTVGKDVNIEDIKDGYIVRDTNNHDDMWYITEVYFNNTYASTNDKTLDNTNINDVKSKVSDVKVFGNGNLFELISKASSKSEGWMKSTKAMEIDGIGVVVQITTQQGDNVAEALTFVPNVKIATDIEGNRFIKGIGY